ncbi:MAG: hypothetical protein AAGF15_08860 [Pseudomonadota bacterium]
MKYETFDLFDDTQHCRMRELFDEDTYEAIMGERFASLKAKLAIARSHMRSHDKEALLKELGAISYIAGMIGFAGVDRFAKSITRQLNNDNWERLLVALASLDEVYEQSLAAWPGRTTAYQD